MRNVLVFLFVLVLGACATRQNAIELGAGYDPIKEVGSNPQSVMRYRNEPLGAGNGWVFEYNHHSSIRDGYPFNDREDQVTNQYSLIYRYVW